MARAASGAPRGRPGFPLEEAVRRAGLGPGLREARGAAGVGVFMFVLIAADFFRPSGTPNTYV